MTFLNPAVLFGLIAASIPILIHLLNLRKLKKIEFSSLIFLKELQKNKIRKIKVKQWLLLVIRTLILVFLVLAFARPAMKGISLGGLTSSAKNSAVLIIDDTFSMSVIRSDGSLFNQAKLHAEEILSQLQEGDEAAIIKMSSYPRDEEARFSKDLKGLRDIIRSMQINQVSGELHSAVVKAADLLSSSNNYNKEIYIISDFQKQRLTEEETLPDLSESLNEKVRIYLIQPEQSIPVNNSVESIKILSGVFEKNKPVEVEGVVKNHSESPSDNITASLFINGERVSQKSVSLAPGEAQRLVFEGVLSKPGYQDIFIEIDDDMIQDDNRRYETVFLPEKVKILMLSENTQDASFLKLALSVANTGNIFSIDESLNSRATIYDLKKYSALVITGLKSLASRTAFEEYISGGGNLIFFPGKDESSETIKDFFVSMAPLKESGKITAVNSEFSYVDLQHPILSGIFVSKEKSKIESPAINTYYRMLSSGGYPVIKLNDGSNFLSEYKYGKGSILLFSVPPVADASDLPFKSIFVPLIYKSVMFLASAQREEQIIAGSPFVVNDLPPGLISIQRANQPEEKIPSDSYLKGNSFTYFSTGATANYFIKSSGGVIKVIPVNFDVRESSAEYVQFSGLKDYFSRIKFAGNLYDIKWNGNLKDTLGSLRFGTELWKYLILLALLLLIAEMLIARANKKDLEHLKNS